MIQVFDGDGSRPWPALLTELWLPRFIVQKHLDSAGGWPMHAAMLARADKIDRTDAAGLGAWLRVWCKGSRIEEEGILVANALERYDS